MPRDIPIWFSSDTDAVIKADWIVNGADAGQFEATTQTEFPKTYKTRMPLIDEATRLTLKGEAQVDNKPIAFEATWNVGNAAPKTKVLRDKSKSLAVRIADYLNSVDALQNGEPLAEPANLARSVEGNTEYQAKIAAMEKSLGAKIPDALKGIGKSELHVGDVRLRSIVDTTTVLEGLRDTGSDWDEELTAKFGRSFVVHLQAMDGIVLLAWDPQAQLEKRPAWFWLEDHDLEFLTDADGKNLSDEAAILSTLDKVFINDNYFESLAEEGKIGPGDDATEDDWIIVDSSHPALSLQFSFDVDESSSKAELECIPRLYNTT